MHPFAKQFIEWKHFLILLLTVRSIVGIFLVVLALVALFWIFWLLAVRSIVGISFVNFDEIFFSKVKDDDDEDDVEEAAVLLLFEFEFELVGVTVFWQEVVVVVWGSEDSVAPSSSLSGFLMEDWLLLLISAGLLVLDFFGGF